MALDLAAFAATALVAIFATVDPPGNVPFYLSLTDGYTIEEKRAVIKKTMVVALVVLIAFAATGNLVFSLFGITIPAFRIAGGLLLLRIAFSMLQGERPKTKQGKGEKEKLQRVLRGEKAQAMTLEERKGNPDKEGVGVVPLGIPLFAGPGSITTVIILTSEGGWPGFGIVSLAIVGVILVSLVTLWYADAVFDRIGRTGALAFARIMGLLLAALAIQYIITGAWDIAESWYLQVVLGA